MKTVFASVSKTAILYWMTGIWIVFFSFNALGSAIMVALAGTAWATADSQTRVLISIAIFVNWSNTIMAFIHKGISAVSEGRPLVEGAQRVETTTSEKTVVT